MGGKRGRAHSGNSVHIHSLYYYCNYIMLSLRNSFATFNHFDKSFGKGNSEEEEEEEEEGCYNVTEENFL